MTEEIRAELTRRLPVAQYVAATAGSLIAELFHKKLITGEKTTHDYVTQLDKNIESMAMKNIMQQFADDGFYGEENAGLTAKTDFGWVVDPIDGTNNYIRGLPLCGFQLAIMHKGVPVYGLIHRPLTKEIYSAIKGEGAQYQNNITGERRKLSVSERGLADAIGIFDARVGKESNKSTTLMLKLANHINMVRVFGVAVFDLPAVADGSVEFLVSGIAQRYDIAAGSLLIEEAGGLSYNLHGEPVALDDDLVIFSNQALKNDLLAKLASSTPTPRPAE